MSYPEPDNCALVAGIKAITENLNREQYGAAWLERNNLHAARTNNGTNELSHPETDTARPQPSANLRENQTFGIDNYLQRPVMPQRSNYNWQLGLSPAPFGYGPDYMHDMQMAMQNNRMQMNPTYNLMQQQYERNLYGSSMDSYRLMVAERNYFNELRRAMHLNNGDPNIGRGYLNQFPNYMQDMPRMLPMDNIPGNPDYNYMHEPPHVDGANQQPQAHMQSQALAQSQAHAQPQAHAQLQTQAQQQPSTSATNTNNNNMTLPECSPEMERDLYGFHGNRVPVGENMPQGAEMRPEHSSMPQMQQQDPNNSSNFLGLGHGGGYGFPGFSGMSGFSGLPNYPSSMYTNFMVPQPDMPSHFLARSNGNLFNAPEAYGMNTNANRMGMNAGTPSPGFMSNYQVPPGFFPAGNRMNFVPNNNVANAMWPNSYGYGNNRFPNNNRNNNASTFGMDRPEGHFHQAHQQPNGEMHHMPRGPQEQMHAAQPSQMQQQMMPPFRHQISGGQQMPSGVVPEAPCSSNAAKASTSLGNRYDGSRKPRSYRTSFGIYTPNTTPRSVSAAPPPNLSGAGPSRAKPSNANFNLSYVFGGGDATDALANRTNNDTVGPSTIDTNNYSALGATSLNFELPTSLNECSGTEAVSDNIQGHGIAMSQQPTMNVSSNSIAMQEASQIPEVEIAAPNAPATLNVSPTETPAQREKPRTTTPKPIFMPVEPTGPYVGGCDDLMRLQQY